MYAVGVQPPNVPITCLLNISFLALEMLEDNSPCCIYRGFLKYTCSLRCSFRCSLIMPTGFTGLLLVRYAVVTTSNGYLVAYDVPIYQVNVKEGVWSSRHFRFSSRHCI